MKSMVIHIGYPKTGTSTIQDFFLTKMHDRGMINFLGKSNIKKYNSSVNLIREVIYPEAPRSRTRISIRDGVNVISNEDIVMSFYGIKNRRYVKTSDPIATAQRLHAALIELDIDDIDIVVSIRNQRDLIYSFYVEMWRWYFRHEPQLDTFHKYLKEGFAHGRDGIFRMFYFSDVIREYKKIFGEEKVHILLFEDMTKNTEQFCERFCAPLGIPPKNLETILAEKSSNTKKTRGDSYVTDDTTLYDEISSFLEKVGFFSLTRKIFTGDSDIKNTLRNIAERTLGKVPVTHGRTVDKPRREWMDRATKEFLENNRDLINLGVNQSDLVRYGYLPDENQQHNNASADS